MVGSGAASIELPASAGQPVGPGCPSDAYGRRRATRIGSTVEVIALPVMFRRVPE
jgi:hypothetical protein